MASSSKQNWQLGDAGILRKKEDEDELLVFGYSCKLFRDDEKALYIDQGKHLIPWMGDDTLKIDRYDGRGTLYDLKQYEPLPGGYDESLWVGLSDSERHVEHLCNEERYRALHHNEDEEALYQEEELKRLHKALDTKTYGEVAFNYEREPSQSKTDTNGEGGAETQDEEGDEPFKAPPELDIPVNMVLPESVKLNAIIEKTALFISGQGAQMEILLKMKQANNPQFEFLSYTSPLHPYYRHLQMAIKTGRYQPKPEEKEKLAGSNYPYEDGDEDDHYLHPSLAPSSSKLELAPSIPSIAYKPSANCAYSMLVNRIKDKQAAFSIQPPGTADAVLPTAEPAPAAVVVKPTPLVIEATPVLYKNSTDTEKTPITSSNISAGLPVVVVTQEPVEPSQVPKKVFTPVVDTPKPVETVHAPFTPQVPETVVVPSMSFLTPPTDVQLIIDKMASYVAKNGREFETIVRNKKDPRFAFLEVTHQYYPYYLHKVDMYEQIENPKPVSQPSAAQVVEPKKEESEESSESEREEEGNSQDGSQKSGEDDQEETQSLTAKPLVAPVCFSIKKPKDADTPLDMKSALPVEESTDEEEEEEKKKKKEVGEEVKIVDLVPAKPEEEVIDLTEDVAPVVADERREKRKDRPAEEKVKDKLASAAREKVAAKARERQLQLERKRRAAAFLTMLRKTPVNPKVQTSQSQDASARASGDEDDVTSVPSSVSSSSESPNPNRDETEDRSNTNGKTNPLLARIQGGRDVVKRPARTSSSESDRPRAKKKMKLKEKKKKSSHKRERTSVPTRSHKHRKEEDSRRRKEEKMKYYKEDYQRKIKKAKKQVRSKSPTKGHRTRSHHNHPETSASASKSKSLRERHSRKKPKRDRKSSLSEHSS